jgi:hypothetical protein
MQNRAESRSIEREVRAVQRESSKDPDNRTS